jgi:hypothetical protein
MGKTGGVGGSGGNQPTHHATTTPKALKKLSEKTESNAFKTLNKSVEMWRPATNKNARPLAMKQSVETSRLSDSKGTANAVSRALTPTLTRASPTVAKTGTTGLQVVKGKAPYLEGIARKREGTPYPSKFEAGIGDKEDAFQLGQRVFGGNEGVQKQLKLPRTEEEHTPTKKHKPK